MIRCYRTHSDRCRDEATVRFRWLGKDQETTAAFDACPTHADGLAETYADELADGTVVMENIEEGE